MGNGVQDNLKFLHTQSFKLHFYEQFVGKIRIRQMQYLRTLKQKNLLLFIKYQRNFL